MKTEFTAREKTVLVSKQGENVLYFAHPSKKSPISCLFYKNPHKTQNCCIVSDIRTRKSFMRTSKRCFVCLKRSHLAKDCSSRIKCFKFSKRHHVALFDLEEGSRSSNSSSVTNIAGVDGNTNIFLQTAKVKVKNCENSYINSARVLFDSCSQLSYITRQLRNRLKLKTVSTRKISIQTFGNKCSENVLEKRRKCASKTHIFLFSRKEQKNLLLLIYILMNTVINFTTIHLQLD